MAIEVPVYRMRNKDDWRALVNSLQSPFYAKPTGVRTGNTREALLFNGDDKVIGFIYDDAGFFDYYDSRTMASTESNQREPFPSQELGDVEFLEAMSKLSQADLRRVFAHILEGMSEEELKDAPIDSSKNVSISSPLDTKHDNDAVLANPPASPASGASAIDDIFFELSSDGLVLANQPPRPARETPAVAIATSGSSSKAAEMEEPPASRTLAALLDKLEVGEPGSMEKRRGKQACRWARWDLYSPLNLMDFGEQVIDSVLVLKDLGTENR